MRPFLFDPLERRAHDVIVVDPPAHFTTYSPLGQQKSPSSQYSVMSDDQIARLPVRELGADDCVMLLWSCGHLIEKSLAWARGWGFTYKTELVWRKITAKNRVLRIGCGFLVRNCHECVLVCTAGRPRRFTFPTSIFDGVVGPHSAKPREFFELCERVFPDRYMADVFARRRREGWACWGNELDRFPAEQRGEAHHVIGV